MPVHTHSLKYILKNRKIYNLSKNTAGRISRPIVFCCIYKHAHFIYKPASLMFIIAVSTFLKKEGLYLPLQTQRHYTVLYCCLIHPEDIYSASGKCKAEKMTLLR